WLLVAVSPTGCRGRGAARRGTGGRPRGHHVPDAADAVAVGVARSRVAAEVVQGVPVEGHLHGPVAAGDDPKRAGNPGAPGRRARDRFRRPRAGARPVTGAGPRTGR